MNEQKGGEQGEKLVSKTDENDMCHVSLCIQFFFINLKKPTAIKISLMN